MKKINLIFSVLVLLLVLAGCDKNPAEVKEKEPDGVQGGEEEGKSLVGEWYWIFKESIDSRKIIPADNKTILKISAVDTIITEDQELAVAYEVFVEDVLFRKGFSPIFKLSSTPTEHSQIWTRKCWIYLPYVEMRSCNIQFVSPNNQPSLDTLCFTGSLDKVYYARMK